MMKRWMFLAVLIMALPACNEQATAPTGSLEGTYVASFFRVTPAGEAEIDALAQGGELRITIAQNNTTTGTLNLPASVGGGVTASMAGAVSLSGSVVTFEQTEDTFVRELSWTRTSTGLAVTDQVVAGTEYTITLRRQ